MSYTATSTQTNTTTEARVRVVMQKVSANLQAFVVRGLLARDRAQRWLDDLTYLQVQGQLEFFELQLDGQKYGLRYAVSADGSVQQDSPSGGLDLYGVATSTSVRLFAKLKEPRPQHVLEELKRRGWRFNGTQLSTSASDQHAFSSGGYGIVRSKLGDWP